MDWSSPAILLAQADPAATGSLGGRFTPLDWTVLIGFFVLVSVLGVVLAGRQKNLEDFFRGGNKLPWYAVTLSIISTVISAVTFVSVPARAYREGGDFTYLQLGLVAGLLSRAFVSLVLVPAYYRHDVYSPYDYMGEKLGEAARAVTTALFSLMGLLAQGARIYLTAEILALVMRDQLLPLSHATGLSPLTWSITIICVISIVWTMLGGIATVIWTDVLLTLIFLAGGVVALAVIAANLPGGFGQILGDGWAAQKFTLFSLGSRDTTWASDWGKLFGEPFTIWAAIFAVTFGNIGQYGTDQHIAQRIFTCRSKRDAQIAMMAGYVGEAVAALMLLVGVGLWAFYRAHPELLVGEAGAMVGADADQVFPVFILTQVPAGLTGLIIAGIFAAAMPTGIIAALAQTTMSAVYLPLRGISVGEASESADARRNRQLVRVSRLLVVFWGVALCMVAFGVDRFLKMQQAAGIDVPFLDLALGLANYVIGSLLAAFLLAWLPLRVNAWGLVFAAPLSVFTVYAAAFHDERTFWLCACVSLALVVVWVITASLGRRELQRRRLVRTVWLIAGCAFMLLIWWQLWFAKIDPATGAPLLDAGGAVRKFTIAWPWYAPLGAFVAFAWGYLLADERERSE